MSLRTSVSVQFDQFNSSMMFSLKADPQLQYIMNIVMCASVYSVSALYRRFCEYEYQLKTDAVCHFRAAISLVNTYSRVAVIF